MVQITHLSYSSHISGAVFFVERGSRHYGYLLADDDPSDYNLQVSLEQFAAEYK